LCFREFLPRLCRELDIAADYEVGLDPYKLQNLEEFPKSLVELIIPYVSPMPLNSWPCELVSDINDVFFGKDEISANLGVIYPSTANDPADCIIRAVDKAGPGIIVGECKNLSNNVDASILLKIIAKFESDKSKGQIYIIACKSVANIRGPLGGADRKSQKQDGSSKIHDSNASLRIASQKYCFWKLRRQSERSEGLKLETLNGFQNTGAEKHVLIIEVCQMYAGSDSIFLKNELSRL
jgi:hypothetical protein